MALLRAVLGCCNESIFLILYFGIDTHHHTHHARTCSELLNSDHLKHSCALLSSPFSCAFPNPQPHASPPTPHSLKKESEKGSGESPHISPAYPLHPPHLSYSFETTERTPAPGATTPAFAKVGPLCAGISWPSALPKFFSSSQSGFCTIQRIVLRSES